MIPIICIVGRKNSGKIFLSERLIPQLQALGYRVGTLKHHHHQTSLDVEGKDSWRHSQAGADAVAVLSPVQFVLFRKVNEEVTPESLIPFLGEVDCVLLEGFKTSPYPKIEIHRPAFAAEPLCAQKDQLIALVSYQPLIEGFLVSLGRRSQPWPASSNAAFSHRGKPKVSFYFSMLRGIGVLSFLKIFT